jgi:hypothetical protein
MRRVLITSGVLGLGTALVFGAAALTATLFPTGATVGANMNGIMSNNVMIGVGKPMIQGGFAAPPPIMAVPGTVVDDGSGVAPPVAVPEPSPSD